MIGDAHVDRRKGHMKSPVTKRTVSINGRKNGVSVEDAFWSTLKEIAHVQGATVSQMVTEIEKSRQRGELVHGDPPVRTRPGPQWDEGVAWRIPRCGGSHFRGRRSQRVAL